RRRKIPKQVISSLLIVVLGVLLTACPSESDIKKAYNTSALIANYTETAAHTIGDLYTARIIGYETKENLIRKLRLVAAGGRRFQTEIDALYDVYKRALPDAQVNALDIMFNREVIAPFVDILTEAGVLSKDASGQILTAVVLLKSAILTVAN